MKSKKFNHEVETPRSLAVAELRADAQGLGKVFTWTVLFAIFNAVVSYAGLSGLANSPSRGSQIMATAMLWISYGLLVVALGALVKRHFVLRKLRHFKASAN